VGLSFHLADDRPAGAAFDARMCVVRDGYVGIAPVPGGRVNIGIVLGPTWRPELRTEGARSVVRRILTAIAPSADDPAEWHERQPCEPIAGTSPLGARVTRRSGAGWLLVGDAAGFLDPFTGEGLHRALISTELAAAAIDATLNGRSEALDSYDRAMRRRFATKDVVSWIVQSFLSRPMAFEYAARRLATRPATRATMSRVMGDLVPASEALDPRFLARLFAP
jgi:flavin-dependent dehydrogenase